MTPDSQPPPNIQALAKNNTTVWVAVIAVCIVFGACGLCTIVGVLGNRANLNRSSARSSYATTTGNPGHDSLLTLSPSDQAMFLGKLTRKDCTGDYAFFRGMRQDTKIAFWSVRCTTGKSYHIRMFPDADGSTGVLQCGVLETLAGRTGENWCFQKLQE